MKEAAAFRGQPLIVLAGVLCAWLGLRVAHWQPSLAGNGAPKMATYAGASIPGTNLAAGLRAEQALPPARFLAGRRSWSRYLSPRTSLPHLRPSLRLRYPVPLVARVIAADLPAAAMSVAVGHNLLLAAGVSHLNVTPSLAVYFDDPSPSRAGILAAAAPESGLFRPAFAMPGSRLSADSWLMLRQDSTPSAAAVRPSYGRSQAGAALRYRLAPSSAHDPRTYVRLSAALEGALERDAVAGFSARPLPIMPVRVAIEARVTETGAGTELRPAIVAVTELPPIGLPRGLRADAYVQGGYVSGRSATAFVDGQGRIERVVARLGDADISAGAGFWGGAQEGAGRLDVGPTAAIAFRVGQARGRLAADYRWRIAGDATPNSGPAVTLSAGF